MNFIVQKRSRGVERVVGGEIGRGTARLFARVFQEVAGSDLAGAGGSGQNGCVHQQTAVAGAVELGDDPVHADFSRIAGVEATALGGADLFAADGTVGDRQGAEQS